MVEDLAELIGPHACCQAVNAPAPFGLTLSVRFSLRRWGRPIP